MSETNPLASLTSAMPDLLPPYRGRLAPSPTGRLHLGHARTFWTAFVRAQAAQGSLVLRNDDLDATRSRPEFVAGFIEDLRWLGISWTEGPDVGGPWGPYAQSERLPLYRRALSQLQAGGFVFPCTCSRRDIASALDAPHAADDEPIYPGTCRSQATPPNQGRTSLGSKLTSRSPAWRFRVPDHEVIGFLDGYWGPQGFHTQRDFGDFVVWRPDDLPSYQLACVVDDAGMQITEVVRGADLMVSTARQLLLFRALGWAAPTFYHCPLLVDAQGVRLAKRHDALSLKTLRAQGMSPTEARANWGG